MTLPIGGILTPLEDGLESIITFLHDDVSLSWGVSIVALTFIVRLFLLPLTLRSVRSTRKMQILAPHLKEVQERYKDDRERAQREMMKVYQDHGLSPFSMLGGCFGLLLQIPFFIAIYQLLRSDGFKADVDASGDPSGLFIESVIVDPTGAELVILCALFAVTMVATFLYTMSVTPTTNPAQRAIFLVLPLMMIPFIINSPAGLAVYWIASNVWTLGQQALVQRVMPAPTPPTPEEIKATRPPPPPPRKRKRRR